MTDHGLTSLPIVGLGELRDSNLVVELIDLTPHPVHKVLTYHFCMLHFDTADELGRINLRVGVTRHIEQYAGHVGYAVHEAHRGHRYAARALRLLLPLAKRLGLDPLWITCDPDNLASRRSLESAGARFVEVVNVPPDCVIHQSGNTKKCRYRLDLGPGSDSTAPS